MKIKYTDSVESQRVRFIVYGPPGIGKTTLASTLKEPVLVISTESGLLSLNKYKLPFVECNNIKDVWDCLDELKKDEYKKKFKWIFVDSLTEIGEKLLSELETKYDKRQMLPMYGEYSRTMLRLVKTLRDIDGYNIVLTACDDATFDDSNVKHINIDLKGKRVSQDLPKYVDQILFFNINKQGERVLLTRPRNNIVCKDRSGKLDEFEKPDLSAIVNKIRGKNA